MLSFMLDVVRGFLWICGLDVFGFFGLMILFAWLWLCLSAFLRYLGLGCTKSYRFPQDDGNGFARLEEGFDFTLCTIL